MNPNPEERQRLVRYLLGQMSEEEMSAVEQYYLQDAAYLELVEMVEDELIDSYLQGELSSEDSRRFREHYLRSPERQRKVEFAAALRRSVQPPRRASKLKYAISAVAAGLLILIGISVWTHRYSLWPAPAVVLVPGDRDVEGRSNVIDADRQPDVLIRAEVETRSKHESWRAVIRTVDEKEILRLPVQRVQPTQLGAAVELRLPVKGLAEGDYILQIEAADQPNGFRVVQSYSIKIVHQP